MWLIAGAVLAALVIWAVVRRRAGSTTRPADKPDTYVCHICNEQNCVCEKPGRQPPRA
jgi:hypothetical protein